MVEQVRVQYIIILLSKYSLHTCIDSQSAVRVVLSIKMYTLLHAIRILHNNGERLRTRYICNNNLMFITDT